jgi:hypothetical protein
MLQKAGGGMLVLQNRLCSFPNLGHVNCAWPPRIYSSRHKVLKDECNAEVRRAPPKASTRKRCSKNTPPLSSRKQYMFRTCSW